MLNFDNVNLYTYNDPVKLLEDYDDTVNLILTDMHMPFMNGKELLIKIREKEIANYWDKVSIMLLSGTSSDMESTEDFKTQFDDVLLKPFKKDMLCKKIIEILQNKSA